MGRALVSKSYTCYYGIILIRIVDSEGDHWRPIPYSVNNLHFYSIIIAIYIKGIKLI